MTKEGTQTPIVAIFVLLTLIGSSAFFAMLFRFIWKLVTGRPARKSF
jgi:hypothetical protein